MGRAGEPQVRPFEGEEYTCVTFRPDLPKFKMSILDKDTVALMTRRAYDVAGSTKGIRVFFNGTKLPVSSTMTIMQVWGFVCVCVLSEFIVLFFRSMVSVVMWTCI